MVTFPGVRICFMGKSTPASEVSKALVALKEVLESAPSFGPFNVKEAESWAKKNKVSIPFYRLPQSGTEEYSHLTLGFERPATVNVIGGYALKACLSPAVIDMTVEMGEGVLREKDHLNYRYFHKKAFYLAAIMKQLQGKYEVDFDCVHGIKFKPCLIVKLPGDVIVRILPTTKVFKPFRLAPSRNSVRAAVLSEAGGDAPTPMVNSSILSELLYEEELKSVLPWTKKIPAFAEGLKLCKAWIKQRLYEGLIGGLSGFHATMLLVHMAEQGVIDEQLDEMQVFKAFLKFLGSLNATKPFSLKRIGNSCAEITEECKTEFTIEAFQKHFDLVFLDASGLLNIFWDLKASGFNLAQMDAKRHYSLFVNSPNEANMLLLTADEAALKYDATIVIDRFGKTKSLDSLNDLPTGVDATLERALTDRIHTLALHTDGDELRVGLVLNPENAFRLVDLGPPIEDKAACDAFRAFWGEKSELRRFKDSSIKEAAVWEEHAKSRHLVVGSICKYILKKHHSLDMSVIDGQLDWVVESGTFAPAFEAFESLSKKVRGLAGLPLTVTSCEAISPSLRYTSVKIPVGLDAVAKPKIGMLPESPAVNEVVVRVEGSGKWPQDPHAASLLKQAMLLQLSKCLAEEHHLEVSFTKDFVDVLCDDYVFRLHMTFAGELALMQRHGLSCEEQEELYVFKPKHARAIHSVYTGNIIYGPAVRLAKTFVASQLYSLMLSGELIELLMTHVFTHQARHPIPHSAWTAFLRFLELLAAFDWQASPLIVNFDPSTKVDTTPIEQAFAKVQDRVCLFVAPSYDQFRMSHWCLGAEHAGALAELKLLAQAALKYMSAKPFGDLSPIFKRSTKGFTGSIPLVDLNCLPVSKRSQLAIKTASFQADFLRYLPGFDPITVLLRELQKEFGGAAVQFYYNSLTRDRIAFKGDAGLEGRIVAFCRDFADRH